MEKNTNMAADIPAAIDLKGLRFFFNDEGSACYAVPIFLPVNADFNYDDRRTVVYPISQGAGMQLTPGEVKIYACFNITPEAFKAFEGPPGNGLVSIKATRNVIPPILPEIPVVAPTNVTFSETSYFTQYDNGAMSGFVQFPLDLVIFFGAMNQVKNIEVDFTWWYGLGMNPGKWSKIRCTRFWANLTLNPPTHPWSTDYTSPTPRNSNYPWTSLVNIACTLAAGAEDQDAAAYKITTGLCNLSNSSYAVGNLQYSEEPAYSSIIENTKELFFRGIDIVEYFDGMEGNGNALNCADFSAFIMFLATSLGCNISVLRLTAENGINLNTPYQLLGESTWNSETDILNYHLVVCTFDLGNDGIPYNYIVYDPCYIFKDGAGNIVKSIGIELLPYLKLLASNSSAISFVPGYYNYIIN